MLSTAEKIETIALCRSSGTLGTFTEYAPGRFRVEADGFTVLVRSGTRGWHVSFKSFEAINPELPCGQDAIDAGNGVNVTRHTDLRAQTEAWL